LARELGSMFGRPGIVRPGEANHRPSGVGLAVGCAVKSRPDFELFGLAADGRDALNGIREANPLVGIVDQHLPSLSGTDFFEPYTVHRPRDGGSVGTGQRDADALAT
jgi:hypothetical protein